MTTPSKTTIRKNRKPEDYIGLKFGRFTVKEIVGRESGPKNYLLCLAECDCGNVREVRVNRLRDGDTKSCGCLKVEINSLPTEARPKNDRAPISSKDKKRAAQLRWIAKNPEKVAAIAKRHRERHPEKIKALKAAYYQEAKGEVCKKLNIRYANDKRFRVEMLIRWRINKAIRLRGTVKSKKAMELLGCSIDELIRHLESQFQEGMSWENRSEWHIDHIKPISSFDILDPEQQKTAFHWTNLQPLFATENLKKSDRLDWVSTLPKSASDPSE